jgi:hypothetical protein
MIDWLSTTALQTARVKSSTTSESGVVASTIEDEPYTTPFTSSASFTYYTNENWSQSSTSSSRGGVSLGGEYEIFDLATSDSDRTTIGTVYATTSTVTDVVSGFVVSTAVEDGYYLPYVESGATTVSFVETTIKGLNVTFESGATKKSTVENTITEYAGGGGVAYNTIIEAENGEVILTMAYSAAADFNGEAPHSANTATRVTIYAPTATSTAERVSAIEIGGNASPLETTISFSASTAIQSPIQGVYLWNELPQNTVEVVVNSVSVTESEWPTVYLFANSNLSNPATTTLYYVQDTAVPATSAGVSYEVLQSQSASATWIVAGDPQVTTASGASSGYSESYTFLRAQDPPILPAIAEGVEYFKTIYGTGGAVANGQTGAALDLVGFSGTITVSEVSEILAGVAREDGFNVLYQTGNAPLAKLFQLLPTTHVYVETADSSSATTAVELSPESWSSSATTADSEGTTTSSGSGLVGVMGQGHLGVFTVAGRVFNKTKFAPSINYLGAFIAGGTIRSGETLYQSIPRGAYSVGSTTSFYTGGMTSYSATTPTSRLQPITYVTPIGGAIAVTTGSNAVAWTVPRNSFNPPLLPEIQF